jgi:hypothetical protein
MRFADAKKEFEIRYYQWATSEFEREIEELFPSFKSFKSGSVWDTYHFMQLLDRAGQRTLAHALLKRFHPDAVSALGETTSSEEKSLLTRRDNFNIMRGHYQGMLYREKELLRPENRGMVINPIIVKLIRNAALEFLGEPHFNDDKSIRKRLDEIFGSLPKSHEEEIQERKKAGEKIKFISKRKLLKSMAEKFQTTFACQCHETYREVDTDPGLAFETKCLDWVIRTHFWFGRSSTLLNYTQGIASEKGVIHQGAKGKYEAKLVMGMMISFTSWLGLTSQIQWEYLTEDEVEPACNEAIKFCNHFFKVAPKLLKGLEFEKLEMEIYQP